jgi:hypothetical protein
MDAAAAVNDWERLMAEPGGAVVLAIEEDEEDWASRVGAEEAEMSRGGRAVALGMPTPTPMPVAAVVVATAAAADTPREEPCRDPTEV